MVAACQHHWLLESSSSRNVPGRCKNCGDTRVFKGTEEVPIDQFRMARQLSTFRNRAATHDDSPAGWDRFE